MKFSLQFIDTLTSIPAAMLMPEEREGLSADPTNPKHVLVDIDLAMKAVKRNLMSLTKED